MIAKELEGNFGGDGKVINLKCGHDRKFYKFSKKILLKGTLKWASYTSKKL